jgi:hypothetical protein
VGKGIAYLKKIQKSDGTWSWLESQPALKNSKEFKGMDVGATALAALTLLECGVPATDKRVQKAADAIRPQTIPLFNTYSLSLAIMFFDRLGHPRDVALIESMAVRLLAGQNKEGGWTYTCPAISEAEVSRLTNHLKKVTKGKWPKTGSRKRRTERDLPKEIAAQLLQIKREGGSLTKDEDKSNTQFAALALWISRRHGLPVDTALKRIRNRFLATQWPNGGWSYREPIGGSARLAKNGPSAAMTCAGLLGLAVGEGAIKEQRARKNPQQKINPNQERDKYVRKGLRALSTWIGKPGGDKGRGRVLGAKAGKIWYFLWALERVGMIYGLRKIGQKDWYGWGSEIILANQRDDGSWWGEYATGGPDTCFALLFLCRSNLALDLATTLGSTLPRSGEIGLKTGGGTLPKTTTASDSK